MQLRCLRGVVLADQAILPFALDLQLFDGDIDDMIALEHREPKHPVEGDSNASPTCDHSSTSRLDFADAEEDQTNAENQDKGDWDE